MAEKDSGPLAWAERISRQSQQLLTIASATHNEDMREELRCFARRLDEQASRIRHESA